MASRGVSARPILLISGKSPFCETFFDNVQADKRNLVGPHGGGWAVAKYLLAHEREMIGSTGDRAAAKPIGKPAAATIGLDASGRLTDPMLRARIPKVEADEASSQLAMKRAGDLGRAGQGHPAMLSMLKYYGAEINKRRWEQMMAIGGADALEWEGERSRDGGVARTWLRTKANSNDSFRRANHAARQRARFSGRAGADVAASWPARQLRRHRLLASAVAPVCRHGLRRRVGACGPRRNGPGSCRGWRGDGADRPPVVCVAAVGLGHRRHDRVMMKTILITGCSSGFGLETAKYLDRG